MHEICQTFSLESQYLETLYCNRNEPVQSVSTWQIIKRGVKLCEEKCRKQRLPCKPCRPMTSKNLQRHCLKATVCLKFLLRTKHKVPLINTYEAKKGRETEKRTANVHESRTVGVVRACQPHFIFISVLHFTRTNHQNKYMQKLLKFSPSLPRVFDKWIARTSCPRTRL